MLSIQQLINTLRRLQVTSNGRSLKAAGRNKVIKNLQRAIDDCVVQIEKQGHRITQNTAIMITSPLSSSTTTTATVTTIPTRSVNDNNHHLKNVQYERRLSELSEIIKMSSLSTITLFSESLSTLVTALRALIILYDSEENKITLNSNSNNTNNNIITIIKDNTNNNNSKNSNINNCSSQLMNLKIGSMATDETDVKIVKITTAIETKTAEILTARTAREVETETKAESVTVTYNKRQELDSLVRRFSTNLYVNEIGSILLNCEWQQRQQQQSYQWNYRKNEKQFNEHSLIQVKLNNENNFIKFYQNNQQFPLVSATTTTKTSILYNRSKQQQQYQKRYIHIRNLMSMDMNQSLNMNDEQQEQNSNELFGAMVTALQQQRLHDCTNADSVGVDGVLCCNNLKNTNSENTVTTTPTTPTTKVNTPMPTTSTTSSKSTITSTTNIDSSTSGVSCHENYATGKPCFNTGLNDILKFMELIGNLKHTKRTGWLLRDVNDCESISGHMYRMGILTFLLDGSEGLNQTRCMELALVHDMAESLVGDITPFCGVSKVDKQAMEFKAMEDICKLIEPRGKRIMELFEEYELGESPESQFVKDLDRLDMVMQAFEYEKRDNCLLKHQEFFDSTAGKFKHPFVKKLVNEIYEQRNKLAKSKGAILPPKIDVPSMELKANKGIHSSNGHLTSATTSTLKVKPEITTTTSATKTTGSTSNSNSTS